jgi:hypothetical protein
MSMGIFMRDGGRRCWVGDTQGICKGYASFFFDGDWIMVAWVWVVVVERGRRIMMGYAAWEGKDEVLW